jgi:hypothetical protein
MLPVPDVGAGAGPFHMDTLCEYGDELPGCIETQTGWLKRDSGPDRHSLSVVDLKLKAGTRVLTTSRCKATLDEPADLRVQLPAELVALQPRPSGWCAVLAIGARATKAIEAFVRVVHAIVPAERDRVFVSPLSRPNRVTGEGIETPSPAMGRGDEAVWWLHVLVNERGHTLQEQCFATNSSGEQVFGANDPLHLVHSRPPLGSCVTTVFCQGYWQDGSRYGPLLHLEGLTLDPGASLQRAPLPTLGRLRREDALSFMSTAHGIMLPDMEVHAEKDCLSKIFRHLLLHGDADKDGAPRAAASKLLAPMSSSPCTTAASLHPDSPPARPAGAHHAKVLSRDDE